MTSINDKATALLALHQPGNPVILPTVWDAWSANLAVAAGFAALTVGSHPVSDSIGKPDNEGITFDELLHRIKQDHRCGRRPDLGGHRGWLRARAGSSHRRVDRCRRCRTQHRGHRSQ